MTTYGGVGQNIVKLLNEKEMTQTYLAKQLFLTSSGLNQKLIGVRRFSINEIKVIKKVLNVSYDQLLEG
jgi:transcriptional regulator with XRE-family HTH domain